MTGWIALSLSLMLGQSPTASDTSAAPSELEAERAAREAQVDELRAQVELLQAQLEAVQEENQGRLQSLEQQQGLQVARAQELEQLRQQTVASMQRGYQWLITMDQLLETGDFDIGPALAYAQRELSEALTQSSTAGRGETLRLIGSALDRLATVEAFVSQRNVYQARRQLQYAGDDLNQAWQLSLNRSGATLVNQ